MWTKAFVAATLAALSAVQAQAAEPPSTRVSYADLDLSRPQDRATLDARLAKAARQVCRREGANSWEYAGRVICQRKALSDARDKFARVLFAMEAKGVQLASK